MKWWFAAAGLLELGGLWLAVWGLWKTWVDYASEKLRTHMWRDIKARASRAWLRVRRWLRIRQDATVSVPPATGHLSINFEGHAEGRMNFDPLPSIQSDPEGFEAEVHTRLQKLQSAIWTAEVALRSEGKKRAKAIAALSAQLEAQAAEQKHETRRLAVDGIELQIYGWALVLSGFLLNTALAIIQA